MNKEFIPYEEALAMKELGFDEFTVAAYVDNELDVGSLWKDSVKSKVIHKAPLYQQAFRWFREKYNHAGLIQLIEPEYGGDYGYVIYYKLNHLAVDHWNKGFKTYEEAELACLKKLIELN